MTEQLWCERFPVGEGIHPRSLLIAFPGAGKSPDAWSALAKQLPEDLELVAIHYPGRGKRFHEEIPDNVAVLAAQAFDVLKVSLLTRPFVLMGHSMGASVAAEVAMLAEKSVETLSPLGLISLGSAPGTDFEGPPAGACAITWAKDFATSGGILSEEDAADLDPMLLKTLAGDLQADAMHMAELRSGHRKIAIKAPIFAMAAKGDELVPPKDLPNWEAWVAPGAPQLKTRGDLEGGHNFHDPPIPGLVDSIVAEIYVWLKDLPDSVVYGEVQKPRYPETTLHKLLLEACEEHADRVAIVSEKKELFSYREFQHRVLVLAKRLCGFGITVDRICPIFMERSVEFLISVYGILSSEAAFAQVEISFPNETIEVILSKIDTFVILTKERYTTKLPQGYEVWCMNDQHWTSLEQGLSPADEAAYANRQEATPDNLFKVPLTSGSTGIPKSIGQVHRSAVCSYWWRFNYIPYGDNEHEASNVFFIWEALRPLLKGATIHIMSESCILDAHSFVDFVLERDITRMLLTPSMGETLLDQIQEASFPVEKREKLSNSRWRLLVHCGEVVSRVLQNKWLNLLPRMTQINLYSIAEVYDVTCSVFDSESENSTSGLYMPAGPVMDGVTVLILRDGKNGGLEIMPQNAVGDIYVAGPCLARGYLGRPEKTAEVFLPNPFKTGHLAQYKTIYKTGDIGRFVPGPSHDPRPVTEIWGRTDSVIKLRGYSVEKGAVQSAIITYPGPPKIEWVNVFRDNDPQTLRTKRIVAAILPVKGEDAGIPEAETIKNIKEWARKKLPAYAMPTMCLIDEVPISASSGKGDMKKVFDKCMEKLQAQDSEAASGPALVMQSFPPEFTVLVEVWNEVLGHPPADQDTSFFEDGGHSLLAAKLVRLLNGRLQGVQLGVIDLMENPSVTLLAKRCGLVKDSLPAAVIDEVPSAVWTGDRPEPIAIIGMSCQFCGLQNYKELWESFLQQKMAVREFSTDELVARGWSREQVNHPDFKPYGGPLQDDDKFDRSFWKISQHEANLMDVQQRKFIQETYTSLEDAGRSKPGLVPELTGVFAATWYSSYLLNVLGGGGALRDPTLGPEDNHLTELGNCSEYAASRTAYLLNLRGMAVGVQTSCSSGLSTVLMGCSALQSRQIDLALTGAASATVPGCGYIAAEGVPLSQDGKTRSFAAEASGTVFTDGVAVAVLKRSSNVEERDRAWACFRGFALNQDGAARASFSAPGVEGQARCLQLALRHARVAAEDVGFIECHATGTTIGDHIEVRGIGKAYGNVKPLVGCGKPLIGHANLASGMAGVVKTAMVLQRSLIPGTLLLGTLNPLLGDVSVGLETQELKKGIASVSSFGIGGTNTHAILEQATARHDRSEEVAALSTWVPFLPLSAKTEESLQSMAKAIGDFAQTAEASLMDMGRRLATRDLFAKRIAVASESLEVLPAQIGDALKQRQADEGPSPAKQPFVALLFSGNGSYYNGLGDELANKCPIFRDCLAEAREACGLTAEDLKGDAARADIAQPALFCVQYALLRTLETWEVPVNAVLGHSLGLFTALVAAGALSMRTAAKLIAERGKLCQMASGGAMVSVAGITKAEAEAALAKLSVSGPKKPAISVVNAPSLVVVSGEEADLKLYAESLEVAHGNKVKCRFLQVSSAYHHVLMQDAADAFGDFAARLGDINTCSKCLVADNITGGWLPQDKPIQPSYFKEHMMQQVRFSDNLETLWNSQSGQPLLLLELGGVALKQIVEANLRVKPPSRTITTVSLSKHIKDELSEALVFGASLGRAWQAGLPMNLDLACGGAPGASSPPYWMPTYCFQKTRCWGGDAPSAEASVQIGVQRLVTFGNPKPSASLVVYCFPYAGGSSAVFYSWAKKASPLLEFVAVELPERGVRANEKSSCRQSYDVEVQETARAIEGHANGRPVAVLGLSSGCVFALNVVSLLEQQLQVEKLVLAARAPPWVVGAESCKVDDDSASSWLLVDSEGCSSEAFKTEQLPLLKLDLSLDAAGCTWGPRSNIKAPLHVFCGTADESFAPHMVHTWGQCLADSSLLDISFVKGGHDFIMGSEFKSKVYKSLGSKFGAQEKMEPPVSNEKLADPASWLHQPGWEMLPSLPKPVLDKKSKTVLFGLSNKFTQELAQALNRNGDGDVLVVNKESNDTMQSCQEILARFPAGATEARRVIYAWLPQGSSSIDYEEKVRCHKQLVQALGALQEFGSAQDPVLVTIIANQFTASVVGLALAATQESPAMLCRVLQLQMDSTDVIPHVLSEALRNPSQMERLDPVVALCSTPAGISRFGQCYSPVKIPVSSQRVDGRTLLTYGGTYVITGALGRIGRALAKHLANKWNANLVLSTRGSANEEQSIFRKSLEVNGNRVAIANNASCDTPDAWGQLFAAAGGARVDGVFHLAGKAELKYLSELCEDENKAIIDGEFSPKELAVNSLEAHLSGLVSPPRFVMLFSSMAAILGGYGMGAYSAANRCLDAAAVRLAGSNETKWLSMNWDDWSFEYTVEQTAAYTEKAAARSMAPEEGLSIIESVLAADAAPSQVLVSTTALPPKMDEWLHQSVRLAALRQPTVEVASEKAAEQSIEMIVARTFKEVLGLDSIPGPYEEFFDLGGDSVSAGPLLRALRAGVPGAKKVNISDIFTLQSVACLAKALQ